jgi:lysozyme
MTLYGPDISNNNFSSTNACLDFLSRLQGEGFSWVEQKVSEGNYYTDPYWPIVRNWCNQNNFLCVGYHYVTTNDAASQAQTWLSNGGGPVAMFDFEANSGDINNFWAVVDAFNAVGVQVALSYIPHWYWQQIGSPDLSTLAPNGMTLISSNYIGEGDFASSIYNGNDGRGWVGYGGATPGIWQFTAGASIGGLSPIDCNAFEGSLDELKAILTLITPTPAPVPVPEPPAPVSPPPVPVSPAPVPPEPTPVPAPVSPTPVIPAPVPPTPEPPVTPPVVTPPVPQAPSNFSDELQALLEDLAKQAATGAVTNIQTEILDVIKNHVPQPPAAPEVNLTDLTKPAARNRALRTLAIGVGLSGVWGAISAVGDLAHVNFFTEAGLVSTLSILGSAAVSAVVSYIARIKIDPGLD